MSRRERARLLSGRIVPSFMIFSPGLPNNAPASVLPVFGPPRVGPLGVCSPSSPGDDTNTDSTVAGTLLGTSGENVANLGTILPLPFCLVGLKAFNQ